jgi:hypothetical protein
MVKKKTSHVKSRKTSRQSQESSGSGRKKTTKKIAAKQQSKTSSRSKAAKKSSTKAEPVKARKRAVKAEEPPVKGRKRTVKGEELPVKARKRAAKAEKSPAKGRKGAVTARKRAVKAEKLPAKGRTKEAPSKGRKAAAKPKKLTAKQLEALKRSEANAKRRALYAEKKAAKAQEEAAKAQKQAARAEKKRATAQTDVNRLLDKLKKSVDKQVQLEQEAKAKPTVVEPPKKKKKKKKKKPKPPNRVFVIGVSDPRNYAEEKEPEEKRTRVSSKANKHSFKYAETFEAAFRGKTRRMPYAMDEVPITRFGITVRVQDIQDVSAAVDDMRAWLNLSMPEGFSAHIEKEADAIVVNLNLGSYTETSNSTKAAQEIRKHSDLIASMVDRARAYSEDGDDFMWFAHWDWDSDYDSIEKSP